VRALERGADDYLDRPFAYEELRARIKRTAPARRPTSCRGPGGGEIRIDRPTRCVSVAGQRLHLAAKEYELLTPAGRGAAAGLHQGRAPREIWGFMSKGRTRTLDSHASRLRNKLRPLTDTPYVINEWGWATG
jgi:DNA-binding response OmpR family regulator